MNWFYKKKKNRKVLPLKKEIYEIDLGSYEFICPCCGTSNKGIIRCSNSSCRKDFSPNRVIKGFRPVVVIQEPFLNPQNRSDEIVLVVPITTSINGTFIGSVQLPPNNETGLSSFSQANVFELTPVDIRKFMHGRKKGVVGEKEWVAILEKLKSVLGLNDLIKIGDQFLSLLEIENHLKDKNLFEAENNNLKKELVKLNSYKKQHSGSEEIYRKNKEEWLRKIRFTEEQNKDLSKELDLYREENRNLRTKDKGED